MLTLKKQLLALVSAGVLIAPCSFAVYAQSNPQHLEQIVGNYIIDVSSSAKLTQNTDARLELQLLKTNGKLDAVNFSHARVKVSQEGQTYFAGVINNSSIGSSVLTLNFPKDGKYLLEVVFYQNHDELLQGLLELNVDPNPDLVSAAKRQKLLLYGGITLVAIVGLVLGWIIGKKMGHKVIEPEEPLRFRTKNKKKKNITTS